MGTWKYLIKVSEKEILDLPEVFEDIRYLKIAQEAKWLIGYWCNKGSCEPRNKPSTWMKSGIRPNSHWGPAIKNRIASQLKEIRHWECELRDYKNLENNFPSTWFIDPPYAAKAGRLYTYSSIDYENLSKWCNERNKEVCDIIYQWKLKEVKADKEECEKRVEKKLKECIKVTSLSSPEQRKYMSCSIYSLNYCNYDLIKLDDFRARCYGKIRGL